MRPPPRQLPPGGYRPRGRLLPSVVIELDCRPTESGGVYISPECQLGAHHGCPGGIAETRGTAALVCHCPWGQCACYQPRPLHLVSG
ncbi:hypothetical protein ACIRBX_03430 [Kitasatospora sp. NPDC096147]|uniref:hypothetical protein n=1 Tax=Kitasatospora sp. NPDC096147 TaxID=3364093 RepID=UPI003821E562